MSSSLNLDFVLYTPWVVFQMDIYMLLLIIFLLIFFQIPGDRTDRQTNCSKIFSFNPVSQHIINALSVICYNSQ